MKGVAVALAVVIFLMGLAIGAPPLPEPRQYEQLCNDLKLAGNGTVDMSTSMLDKRIAMEYFNALSGTGLMEMNLERVYSQAAGKIARNVSSVNETKPSHLNLYESSRVTYSGLIPLVGEKYLRSKEFYGGIGASVEESLNVNDLEQDELTHFGSTETATGAHLIGIDTKNAFNGSWKMDSNWHKIFYKDIKTHQEYSGKFEIDRQTKFQEQETRVSALEVKMTPSKASIKPGDIITYEYIVKNTGQVPISGVALSNSDTGKVMLSATTLLPGQSTFGSMKYAATEDDILGGPRNTTANATGRDSLGAIVRASNSSSLIPDVIYYPLSMSLKAMHEQERPDWTATLEPLNLTIGNLTVYTLGVNMTLSRLPAQTCPYEGWQDFQSASVLQSGVTDGNASAWQELTLVPGLYRGSQNYTAADGNSSSEPAVIWNSTYGGLTPNGGFACTQDAGYDKFDLKLVLRNLGRDSGMSVDSYQRIHKSTEPAEPAGRWRQIGHQEIAESGMNKTAIWPFITVANIGNESGSNIEWSGVIVSS